MTVRIGMADLILQARSYAQCGSADWTTNGVTYWSDQQIQDVLDRYVDFVEDEPLVWKPEMVGGGTVEYHNAQTRWRYLEQATSGSAYWGIKDGLGATEGTANYTPEYGNGRIRWSADKAGTSFYLTARSYDVHSAAADLWNQKQAYYASWYQFGGDGQTFHREQAYDHAVKMEAQYRAQVGQNRQRGAVSTGVFLRTDFTRSDPETSGADNPHPNRPDTRGW